MHTADPDTIKNCFSTGSQVDAVSVLPLHLQLLMRLSDSLPIRLLPPVMAVLPEEPHRLPVEQEQRASCRSQHPSSQTACMALHWEAPVGQYPLDARHVSGTDDVDVLPWIDQHLVASGAVPCSLGTHAACIWTAGQPPPDCAARKFWPLSECLSILWAIPRSRPLPRGAHPDWQAPFCTRRAMPLACPLSAAAICASPAFTHPQCF
jgi:hypothetical protein